MGDVPTASMPERPVVPARTQDAVDVSVLIPVLNESEHLRAAVAAMQAQRFDGSFELLFADGRSVDDTRAVLHELARQDPRIRVLDNPRRGTASGLNVCLAAARGEFVARMDAHTYYPRSYLQDAVERLRRGGTAWVSGPQVPTPVGPVSQAVALALESWLGRGGSRKWDGVDEERELDTGVFGGVWRRDVVLASGGWDERFPVNQDSEMAARFLARGERLVSCGELAASYVPRNSLRGLARQYRRYGCYRARTFLHHPRSARRSHAFAPALAGALVTAVAPRTPLRTPARLALGAYGAAVLSVAARVPARDDAGPADAVRVAAVLPTMHLAWGFGALAGLIRFGLSASRSERDRVYAPSLHSAVAGD